MASTQDHLIVEDIRNDLVILKDGSMAVVLKTTAVNFGLLSENEQLAIISAFASFLNSLSFAIQIVIRSERLDISSYLNYLEKAHLKQNNPLLANMIIRYKSFIEKTVKENKVLDKQFYIVILVSHLELGIIKDVEKHLKKALTIAIPRRDHIIKQLWRMGLKAQQLNSEQLVNLFYQAYNPTGQSVQKSQPAIVQAPIVQPKLQPIQLPPKPLVTPPSVPPQVIIRPPLTSHLAPPFVVEELADEYSNV